MDGDQDLALLIDRLDAVDDRTFAALIATLRADHPLQDRLRAQLAMAELLSQELAPARQGFTTALRYRLAHPRPTGRFLGRVLSTTRRARGRRRTRNTVPFAAFATAAAAAAAVLIVAVLMRDGAHAPTPRLAMLDIVGMASIRHDDGRAESARAGMPLRAGDVIAAGTDPGDVIAITTVDGTVLRGDPGIDLVMNDATRFRLSDGTLHVDVPHRPGAQRERLLIATDAGDISVTGTRFTLTATGPVTALAMAQGSVRFANPHGAIAVAAPDRARAAVGTAPRLELRFADRVAIEFHDDTHPLAVGARLDAGEPYDAARGYGWIGPLVGEPIPGAFDVRDGVRSARLRGRVMTRTPPRPILAAGSVDHVETWMMDVPDGRYAVTVRCGDSKEQGPHHVRIEGVQVVDRVITRADEAIERNAIVDVRDGQLTMEVGGPDAGLVADDGTSDTVLVSLVIEPRP
ncbi:MAG: FecR domain-containing protein [Planctomycetes bacterium]|nr:FecR domain-containing protein [Planctomycetota bacterium]